MHFCHVFFPLLLGLVHVTGTFAVDPVNPIPPPARYNLQTKVVGDHKDCGSDKNNLWLYSYHTGAALGDAALSPNKSSAWEAYLNDTRQSFTLGGIHTAPWYLSISWYNPYTNFDFVEMTVLGRRGEQQGFYFNETGLQRNSSGGQWYACDWWHGVPQLFRGNTGNDPLPASCSRVNILPIPLEVDAPIH